GASWNTDGSGSGESGRGSVSVKAREVVEKAELMGDLVRTDQQPGIHAPSGPQGIRRCNQLTATLVRLPDSERAVCRYAVAFVRVGTRKARPPRRLKHLHRRVSCCGCGGCGGGTRRARAGE